jgi:UDP-glucose 4-epimerase
MTSRKGETMNVLLTGAFGNVGTSTLAALLEQGHTVRCFDLKTQANVRTSRRFRGRIDVVWGDLRRREDVAAAVHGQDVVVHLAFIIPKLSVTGFETEDHPSWAHEINVGGTHNLLEAMKAQPRPARLLFASSYHIYGRTQHQDPPRTAADPLQPIEHYAFHKIECEEMIRNSGLEWAIFRLAATLPLAMRLDPGMFDIPLDNRMEYVHTRDVGLAFANAIEEPRVWGKVLLIGGGPRCQYTYRQITGQVLEGMGVGALPEEAFGRTPFPTDWLATQESQDILQYQRLTLKDYVKDMRAGLGARCSLIRACRPLVRAVLLSQSPYLRGEQPSWLALLINKLRPLRTPPEVEAR